MPNFGAIAVNVSRIDLRGGETNRVLSAKIMFFRNEKHEATKKQP